MARDLTVGELREIIKDSPEDWPVMCVLGSMEGGVISFSRELSHVDKGEGMEGVWLYTWDVFTEKYEPLG